MCVTRLVFLLMFVCCIASAETVEVEVQAYFREAIAVSINNGKVDTAKLNGACTTTRSVSGTTVLCI